MSVNQRSGDITHRNGWAGDDAWCGALNAPEEWMGAGRVAKVLLAPGNGTRGRFLFMCGAQLVALKLFVLMCARSCIFFPDFSLALYHTNMYLILVC